MTFVLLAVACFLLWRACRAALGFIHSVKLIKQGAHS